jgi:hypothetical protein
MRDETLFGEAPVTQTDRLRTQLAAVRLLVERTEREVAYDDILIATILEVLQEESLPTHEVASRVRDVWPAMRLSDSQLASSVACARRLGLISESARPTDGALVYSLEEGGRGSLSETRSFAAGVVDRFNAQLSDELFSRRTVLAPGDADAIGATVLAGIRQLVADAFRPGLALPGESLGGWLRIPSIDEDAITRFVSGKVTDPERSSLVGGLLRLALDHASAFGNEIVHELIVGYLLYLFMTRPDHARAAESAGSLEGERLIIDTPVLVQLLGPPEVRQPVLDLLARAKQAGMDVRLHERTIEEFRTTLETTGIRDAPTFEKAMRGGADPQLLATGTRSRQVTWSWLRWCERQPLNRRTWNAWMTSDGPERIVTTMGALGFTAEMGETGYSFEAAARIADFRDRLAKQIEARDHVRDRTEEAITHDAKNLWEIWQSRVENPATESKVWPGGFLLSPDKQIGETYEAVAGPQVFPVAITVSQCAQIISAYSGPKSGEELARSLAAGVAAELLLERAANIPPQAIAELALAVTADPVSHLEAQQMQLELRECFASRRDSFDIDTDGHTEIAGQIAERMRKRRSERERVAQKRDSEEATRAAVADALKRAEVESLREQVEALKRESPDPSGAEDNAEHQRIRDRVWLGIVLLLVVVAAVCLGAGMLPQMGVLLVGAIVVGGLGKKWVKGDEDLLGLVLQIAVAVVTLGPAVWTALRR